MFKVIYSQGLYIIICLNYAFDSILYNYKIYATISIYVDVYMCIYIYIFIYAYMYLLYTVSVCIYIYIYTYTCVRVYVSCRYLSLFSSPIVYYIHSGSPSKHMEAK